MARKTRQQRTDERRDVPHGHKRCKTCQEILLRSEFYCYTSPRSLAGRPKPHCKRCQNKKTSKYNKERYRNDPNYAAARRKQNAEIAAEKLDISSVTAVKARQPWTDIEDNYLREHATTTDRLTLALHLERTEYAVRCRLYRLSLESKTQTKTINNLNNL